MRRGVLAVAVVFGCLTAGWAAGLDEAMVVGRVSAADHEIAEGYFSMGEEATLVAKPGSELYRWLASHRGEKVRLVITTSERDLADPARDPATGRDQGAAERLPTGGRLR
jgi:hypothetical protein